jgi:hypothetical protein
MTAALSQSQERKRTRFFRLSSIGKKLPYIAQNSPMSAMAVSVNNPAIKKP